MPSPPLNTKPSIAPPPRHIRQIALQFSAVLTVISLAWPYFALRGAVLPWPATAIAIGCVALAFAIIAKLPWWWKVIHAIFVPSAWLVAQQPVNPQWFLLAFGALLLVFRGAFSGQIPLYLTNASTTSALYTLLSCREKTRFIDLGAGTGSVIAPLAEDLPEHSFTGVENAPATWLIGYLRTSRLQNCCWRWEDIWRTDLSDYDVVYAYLSPAPMTALWEKIQHEMRPGTLFISNNFPVEGVKASRTIEINNGKNRLYCYQQQHAAKDA